MNIVVLVKQVPDTWAERKLKDADGTLDRASVDGLINELDEYAIEEGLQIAEAQRAAGADAEVTILTMGPEKAAESIRKALSMGADKAVHLLDDGLAGSDALSTSYALAQVLAADRLRPGHPRVGIDRRPDGRDGRDAGRAARRAAGLAGQQGGDRRLGDPHPPGLRGRVLRGRVHAARGDQRGREDQRAALPVVQGHHGGEEEAGADAVSLADAGIDPALVGLGGAATEVVDHTQRPPRQAGTVVKDEGDGGVKVAEFLAAQKFI